LNPGFPNELPKKKDNSMTPHSSPLTPHVSVIGAGYWGKNLGRNFHQLGVLKTICDQSSAIRQQMAKDYPDTRE